MLTLLFLDLSNRSTQAHGTTQALRFLLILVRTKWPLNGEARARERVRMCTKENVSDSMRGQQFSWMTTTKAHKECCELWLLVGMRMKCVSVCMFEVLGHIIDVHFRRKHKAAQGLIFFFGNWVHLSACIETRFVLLLLLLLLFYYQFRWIACLLTHVRLSANKNPPLLRGELCAWDGIEQERCGAVYTRMPECVCECEFESLKWKLPLNRAAITASYSAIELNRISHTCSRVLVEFRF